MERVSPHAGPAEDAEEAARARVFLASRGGAAPASRAAPICGGSRVWKLPLLSFPFRAVPGFNGRQEATESLVDVVTVELKSPLTQK